MGHAFTAVANDEMVLYYNPAALRSVQYNPFEIFNFNATTNVKASGPLHGSISSDDLNTEEGGVGAIARCPPAARPRGTRGGPTGDP